MSTAAAEPHAVDPDHLPPISVPGRMGPRAFNRFRALFGLPWQRRLAYAALQVDAVRHWEAEYDKLDDAALRKTAAKLRGRARGGESLDKLLPEAFGSACVHATHTLGLAPLHIEVDRRLRIPN